MFVNTLGQAKCKHMLKYENNPQKMLIIATLHDG